MHLYVPASVTSVETRLVLKSIVDVSRNEDDVSLEVDVVSASE